MTYKFGQVLTDEDIALVVTPPKEIEPTEIQSVPTDMEMATWMPNPDPTQRRFKWEMNVQTGERKATELTLDEYRKRHVNKIKLHNELVLQRREEARLARRQAILEKLIDDLEAKERV